MTDEIPKLLPPDQMPPIEDQAGLEHHWRAMMGELGFAAPQLWVLFIDPHGIVAGALAIFQMVDALRGADRMPRAAALLVITVCCMGSARHLIREALLDRPSKALSTGASFAKMGDVNVCNEAEEAHGHQPGSGHHAPQAPGRGDLPHAG